MVRIGLFLVSLALAASGCRPTPDLPRDVYIEGRATEKDRAIIRAMIDEHNRAFGSLRGGPVYVYKGIHDDPDGFTPLDFEDQKMVIYVFYDGNNAHERLYRQRHHGWGGGNNTVGYGTLEDLMVMRHKLPNDQEFAHTTLHELGHSLGLGHQPLQKDAVMYPTNNGLTKLSIHDQRIFCQIHDCVVKLGHEKLPSQ